MSENSDLCHCNITRCKKTFGEDNAIQKNPFLFSLLPAFGRTLSACLIAGGCSTKVVNTKARYIPIF